MAKEERLNIVGESFGSLVVLAFAGRSSDKRKAVLCKCVCGNYVFVIIKSLDSGNTKSCGCSRIKHFKALKNLNTTHGMSYSKTYGSWHAMLGRVLNTKDKDYPNYGGRGITVCDRWLKFENFYKDMGERPEKCTLDRVDNSKGYCPENCKWSTDKEQSNNRRSSKIIEFNGTSKTLTQWSEILKIKVSTLSKRLKNYGWSIDKAFTTNVR